MPPTILGPRRWKMSRDSEGHREYTLTTEVVTDDPRDGPAVVLSTPGLPLPGSFWSLDNDDDPWATCLMDATVTPMVDDEPNIHWLVEQRFSTKPPAIKRCQEYQQEDPLLQNPKISGQFAKVTEEATYDRFGRRICNSAWEPIRGPQTEFDRTLVSLRIEQNVATFTDAVTLPKVMMNTVNDRTLWGMVRRTVRLSNGSWEQKFYGSCSLFYSRVLEFSMDDLTHDRDILDEATKMLAGQWATDGTDTYNLRTINGAPADPRNPAHFVRAVDRDGNQCRIVLNGAGVPALTIGAINRWFISITSVNAGNALTNMARWIPASGLVDLVNEELLDPTGTIEWRPGASYIVGDAVTLSGGGVPSAYVAVKNSPGNENPVLFPATWVELTAGANDRGDYNAATTYAKGDYVRAVGASGTAGSIHVERYPESNFLLLGIPAIL